MSLDFVPISELDAVNAMLGVIGESPVSQLDGIAMIDVSIARQILHETSREVQTTGYNFNTEYNYPLPNDSNGFIPIPTNTLWLDITNTFSSYDLVQRGGYFYDRANHTKVITIDSALAPLKADIFFFLAFSDIPQYARNYITIKAARRFQRRMLSADTIEKMTAAEELEARIQMEQADSSVNDYNMLTSNEQLLVDNFRG